jgi:hypothetical protein
MQNLSPTLRTDLPGNARHDSLPGQPKARQKPLDRNCLGELLTKNTNDFGNIEALSLNRNHWVERVFAEGYTVS